MGKAASTAEVEGTAVEGREKGWVGRDASWAATG